MKKNTGQIFVILLALFVAASFVSALGYLYFRDDSSSSRNEVVSVPTPIPVVDQQNKESVTPTSTVIVAPSRFEAPIQHEAYSEIILPAGVSFGHENSPADGKMLYDALKQPKALKFVYGKGERAIAVFSDPTSVFDVGFFNMLEQHKDNLNATVYVLPYADSPESEKKVKSLFCAPNPEDTWKSWISAANNGVDPANLTEGKITEAVWNSWVAELPASLPEDCVQTTRLEQIKSLSSRLGVQFTPTVVFAHGDYWPGPILNRSDLERVWAYVHGHLKQQG